MIHKKHKDEMYKTRKKHASDESERLSDPNIYQPFAIGKQNTTIVNGALQTHHQ